MGKKGKGRGGGGGSGGGGGGHNGGGGGGGDMPSSRPPPQTVQLPPQQGQGAASRPQAQPQVQNPGQGQQHPQQGPPQPQGQGRGQQQQQQPQEGPPQQRGQGRGQQQQHQQGPPQQQGQGQGRGQHQQQQPQEGPPQQQGQGRGQQQQHQQGPPQQQGQGRGQQQQHQQGPPQQQGQGRGRGQQQQHQQGPPQQQGQGRGRGQQQQGQGRGRGQQQQQSRPGPPQQQGQGQGRGQHQQYQPRPGSPHHQGQWSQPIHGGPWGAQPAMAQAPMAQAPMAQAPMAQAPMAQAPMAQAPMAQAPMAQAPMAQAPMAQAPMAQAPKAQPPAAQAVMVQPRAAQPPTSRPSGKLISLPQRKDCPPEAKLGRPIKLEVNHLLLQIKDPNIRIYHYDVTIDPDRPKRFIRPVMQEMQRLHYPKSFPGFDGRKNLYSKGPLPFGNETFREVNVADEERQDKAPKTFKVTIKLARDNISLQGLFSYQREGNSTNPPQDVIQAVDVILRSASARNFIQVGRSFFCPQDHPLNLGSGMELWLGFFQSFIMGHRPYLNIDVAHKGFPKEQPLLVILSEFAPRAESPMEAFQNRFVREAFEKFIKGLKVEYKIPRIDSSKRTYRVNGLRNSAMHERFQLNDGRTMTIGEYFEKEKQYKLRFPDLPCVHVGSREKEIMVPIELCLLLGGQPTQKKLDEQQTSAMVKAAATNVNDRKRKIREAMRRANLNSSAEVQEFGLSVVDEFAKVSGRILPPPKLAYNRGVVIEPSKGVWRGGPFLQTRHLKKWVVVSTMSRFNKDAINDFASQLMNEARKSQMTIENNSPTIFLDDRNPRFKNDLHQTFQDLRRNGFELVLVIISGFNKQIYGQVKQAAEIQVGILTQCVKDVTVLKRCNQATIHNILLKINAKFNGINQVIADSSKLKCFNKKILVIGADVTHPSPDSVNIPSVAAVTASHDLKGFKYNMKIRLQPPRQEIIEDLQKIVAEQISSFQKETGGLPEHIIFYRDGVSEGQFQQVLDQELKSIRFACTQHKIRPLLTFLVVQKRHHTRFFPMDPRDSHDRNGNVPAGTIVDTDITHPTEIDFYLVSHASIQGVARPTKYHVLWDDAKMSENEIHLLTYSLCHLFTRCDRAVSYPAPTYYAHLAASRGRVYLEGQNIVLENLEKESRRIQTAMNFTNISPMYFV